MVFGSYYDHLLQSYRFVVNKALCHHIYKAFILLTYKTGLKSLLFDSKSLFFSKMQSYVLPDLFKNCSFTFAQNPHYIKAGPESAAWLDSYNVFSNQKRQDLIHSCSEMLVRNAYPYASYQQFRICCDFVNLLFVVDEVSDEQDGKNAYETGQKFLRTLYGAPCDGSVLSRMTEE